jgi:sulfatase maturation enzyme AslB (radical SAM superfamily)
MKKQYITLSPSCIIRQFKTPHVYDIEKDELYEINKDALQFLTLCDGSRLLDELTPDEDFLAFCLSEKILQLRSYRKITSLSEQPAVLLSPSLRYLEVQITNQCNLQCRHCYIEKHPPQNLSPTAIKKVLNEFPAENPCFTHKLKKFWNF